MSDIVIKAEGLGKKYVIGHQAENGSYLALRDVLMHNARGLWQKTRDLAQGKPIILGNTTEEVWALKDVSFEIRRGEAVGIIGRNGAGKSTLLKVLSRITEPSAGRVTIKGRVASLLEVGTGFHPELTGRENVYLNGAILGMTRVEIKRKFDEIVAFAEVERFLDTPVKRYSSGMYVRLAFAVAAHLEPEILLVDEVLAVGDAKFQKKCLGKMQGIANVGRTVLFVSHNMLAVQSLCPRTLLLRDGESTSIGATDEVIREYLNTGTPSGRFEVFLQAHTGRSRFREVALRRVWILNQYDEYASELMMGASATFCYEFDCRTTVTNPGFGFGVEDGYGRRVFSFNNYMSPSESSSPAAIKSGIACCSLPSLPLTPGRYFLSISLVENQNDWVDYVEQALEFDVIASDVYESGQIPSSSQGVVFVPGTICVRSNDSANDFGQREN